MPAAVELRSDFDALRHAAAPARRPALHISLAVRGDLPEEGDWGCFDVALGKYPSHAVAPQ